jgi:hypothetical protein
MSSWIGWRGDELKRLYAEAAPPALLTVGKEILAAAKEEVPEDSGDLRDSGRVTKSRKGAATPSALISFRSQYAKRWHENPEGVVFKRGRKKAYLRDPFDRIAPRRVPEEYRAEIQRRRGG